jgi:hypothetical protein
VAKKSKSGNKTKGTNQAHLIPILLTLSLKWHQKGRKGLISNHRVKIYRHLPRLSTWMRILGTSTRWWKGRLKPSRSVMKKNLAMYPPNLGKVKECSLKLRIKKDNIPMNRYLNLRMPVWRISQHLGRMHREIINHLKKAWLLLLTCRHSEKTRRKLPQLS